LKKSIIFPGQGSQKVGMGKDIHDNFAVAKEVFQEVDDTLKIKLSEIIFVDKDKTLNHTINTQPAIMTVGVAIFRVIEKELGLKINHFDYCAGHSLGEYTALVCAGSLNLTNAAIMLRKRGAEMQSAVKIGEGGMAAILGAEIDEINRVIVNNNFSTVEISNDNCPGQVVISGKKNEIEICCLKIKEDLSKKSISLPVSAPFHCNLMKPAAEQMKSLILETNFKQPEIPIISNVTAREETSAENIKNLLIEQIYSRVRWREIIEFMIKNKVTEIHELGPGKSLSAMIKRFDASVFLQNYSSVEEINKLNKQI
jgi:[acyl-carrier-protein] S-malonyltransferase